MQYVTRKGRMFRVYCLSRSACTSSLGRSFSGAQGLCQYIHDSPQYPVCVARRLYSYSRGVRSWSIDDFPEAYQAFQNSGFRLRALLRSMALSESFYAALPPAPPTDASKGV